MDHPPADLEQLARDALAAHRGAVEATLATLLPLVVTAGQWLIEALDRGGKVLVCGNGGSAAEAQHLAAELVGRFQDERRPLPAVALTADTAVLTALGNDFGYREVFARQVEALAGPGDVVVLLSTSGRSESVVEAARRARRAGAVTVALTGRTGGALAPAVDLALCVPADDTARVQEVHLLLAHVLCQMVDRGLARLDPAPARRDRMPRTDGVASGD